MVMYPRVFLLLLVAISTVQGSSLGGSSESNEEPQCSEPFESLYYEDETYDRPCQRLAAAMMQYVAWVRDMIASHPFQTWEDVKQEANAVLGIDIEDENQVMQLACGLEDVHTLDELIEKLNMVQYKDHIEGAYHQAQLFLARIDGFHGVRMAGEIALMAQHVLRHLTGKEEGEMLDPEEVMRVMDVEKLGNLLANLEELYGSGYLIYFLMRPYNDALVGVDHKVLAQAIFDRDIACRLGVSQEIENNVHQQFNSLLYAPLSQDMLDMGFDLYIAADQMGLLNLRT